MKQNKKFLIGILSVCLIAVMAIGGTLAFLTDTDEVTNTFTVGDLKIDLTEPNWDNENDGKNLVPGDTEVKDPTVIEKKNNSYMRMIMTIVDNDEKTIKDTDRLDLILKTVRFDATYDATTEPATVGKKLLETSKYSLADLAEFPMVNSQKFTLDTQKSGEGVYYFNYNTIFEKDEKAVLFTNIVIPTDWGQTELAKVGNFNINLQAQAIQTDGFTNATEAFAALDAELA